jgi:hypothetical protein
MKKCRACVQGYLVDFKYTRKTKKYVYVFKKGRRQLLSPLCHILVLTCLRAPTLYSFSLLSFNSYLQQRGFSLKNIVSLCQRYVDVCLLQLESDSASVLPSVVSWLLTPGSSVSGPLSKRASICSSFSEVSWVTPCCTSRTAEVSKEDHIMQYSSIQIPLARPVIQTYHK